MIITIKDTELHLNNNEVRSAKLLITNFINKIRDASEQNLNPTYYFTALIIMHTLSQSLINDIDVETMKIIIDILQKKD